MKQLLDGFEVPGWLWPVIIVALNELLKYYGNLNTQEAALIVIAITAVLKGIEVYRSQNKPVTMETRTTLPGDTLKRGPGGLEAVAEPTASVVTVRKVTPPLTIVAKWILG